LAIIDIETGALSWQSSPIEAGQEWLSRHILLVEDRFLIVVPGSEQTLLLVLDPTSGQFTDAVQLVADGAGMDSTVLSHHLLELHLYPERFRDGRLYGSARDQVFSLSLTDWTVHSYRGDPISVEISWKQAGELLGELPKRP
jgi:hypothetical protein